MATTGLRARKKAKTRDVIVEAALALFEARGYDGTTIDDIAAAADVSARTVFRYFTSKEDLVFLGQDEENRRLADAVKRAPRSDDPIAELMRVTRTLLLAPTDAPALLLRSQKLIAATPALQEHRGKILRRVEALVADALVPPRASAKDARTGRMLAAVYLAALDVAMQAWIQDGAKGTPAAALDDVEALLRRAFAGQLAGLARESAARVQRPAARAKSARKR